MSPWVLTALLVAAALAIRHVRSRRDRDALAQAMRDRWGRPRPIATDVDHDLMEAWRDRSSAFALDARTWDDLDLPRVLASIDHTETLLGAQLLHQRVRDGVPWQASPTLDAVAAQCTANPSLRDRLGEVLASAGRGLGRGFWRLTAPGAIRVRWWYGAFPVLTVAMTGAIAWALLVDPRALLAVAGLAVLNMAGRAAATWHVPELLVPIRQLALLLGVAERLLALEVLPDATRDRLRTNLQPLRPLRPIVGWLGGDSAAGGELAQSLREYVNVLLLLDANALLFAGRRLRRHAAELLDVATCVGEIDLARAVASLRAEPRPWCRPVFDAPGRPAAAAVWHPLVVGAVANDVPLDEGGGLVITGANMSGKSTYLRAAGIAAVLAVTLETCPASAWSGPGRRVRSLIGRADDLASGRSYYLVEAEGVAGLLHDAATAPATLYLLDELLRGTNTVERIAAGEAVVRALAAPDGVAAVHTVFVATHDGELATLLADQLETCHFRETVDASGLRFDFVRHAGVARTRTAIALLAACGAPLGVVQAAQRRATSLEAERDGVVP
jgi:hypothetical protein